MQEVRHYRTFCFLAEAGLAERSGEAAAAVGLPRGLPLLAVVEVVEVMRALRGDRGGECGLFRLL